MKAGAIAPGGSRVGNARVMFWRMRSAAPVLVWLAAIALPVIAAVMAGRAAWESDFSLQENRIAELRTEIQGLRAEVEAARAVGASGAEDMGKDQMVWDMQREFRYGCGLEKEISLSPASQEKVTVRVVGVVLPVLCALGRLERWPGKVQSLEHGQTLNTQLVWEAL